MVRSSVRLVVSSTVFLALACAAAVAAPAAPRVQPDVAGQLAAAKKAGAPVFLLVTAPRARKVDVMRAAVRAAQQKAPTVRLVEMDRSQAANRALVKRYGLAGVGVPMVLVIASNGAPGGGAGPDPKAAERMLSLLPSPRKADTLLALFEHKAAFVVVTTPKMPHRMAVLTACQAAAIALEGKAAVIEVSPTDKKELGFLKVLGADLKAADAVVHVYGLSGKKTGTLKDSVTSDALVAAAKKKASCCAGGKCG